jgi:protein-tyrosine phosphatase
VAKGFGEFAVDRVGQHELELRWDAPLDSPLRVGLGASPDATTHRHVLVVPSGALSVRIKTLPEGRTYVSISARNEAQVLAERRVPFEGASNFRDLGGYQTQSGARTRWGQVFRSDGLHRLTAPDLRFLDHLGVRAIYDLRSENERAQYPNPVESKSFSLLGAFNTADVANWGSWQERHDGESRLRDVYIGMLATAGGMFGAIFTELAEDDGVPALLHCMGGKDRTGLAAALLLSFVGVDREVVLDDYKLTRRFQTIDPSYISFLETLGVSAEAAAALIDVSRWAMAEALDVLDASYGGAEAYLSRGGGMSSATLLQLYENLVSDR